MLANDRRIAENSARIPFPYRAEDAESFIATANKGNGEFAFVITLHDETIIGAIVLTRQEPSQELELCLWLGVALLGQGYATEALQSVIDYAFTELGHNALQAGTRVTNPASRRALEKCGFQWTGVGLYRIKGDQVVGPDRPLPAGARYLVGNQGLGQGHNQKSGVMYQPPHFREDRREVQHALIKNHSLGLLITAGPEGLQANFIPF